MHTNRIAAVVMLAALSAPVLAGCGPSEQEQRESSWQATKAASTTAALAARQQAADDFAACTGGKGYDRLPCYKQIKEKYGVTCADGVDVSSRTYDSSYVTRCADDLVRAATSGTPIPTASPTGGVSVTTTTTATAAPTSAPAPAQQASDSGHGLGDSISGLFGLLFNLALGFACIFGIPGVIGYVIFRRVRADRRERAHAQSVHREEGQWQSEDDYRPYAAPDQYNVPADDHNPWA